jgi:hypothetical protein
VAADYGCRAVKTDGVPVGYPELGLLGVVEDIHTWPHHLQRTLTYQAHFKHLPVDHQAGV